VQDSLLLLLLLVLLLLVLLLVLLLAFPFLFSLKRRSGRPKISGICGGETKFTLVAGRMAGDMVWDCSPLCVDSTMTGPRVWGRRT
jgi:hypothetical protein